MQRSLALLLALSLTADGFAARTAFKTTAREDEKGGDSKVRPKRVLFRTDSPRLFAPSTPRKPEPPPRKPDPTLAPTARTERPSFRVTVTTLPPKAPAKVIPQPASVPPAPARDIEFQRTTFTPYDAYLGTVRSVMANLDEHNATMVTACELMREGRGFRYTMTDPYRAQLPSLTEARRAGDCKSKALWLYDHLGDPGAFYTIGKLQRGSPTSHAWVYWRYQGRWWILDPTGRSSPIAADSVSESRYVPYYSYSRTGAFRHQATRLMMASASIPVSPAVATRTRTSIARETPRSGE